MAAQAREVDQILSRPGHRRAHVEARRRQGRAKLRGHGRWHDFPDRAASPGDRDHRAFCAQAVRLVLDPRCRPFCCSSRIHGRSQGSGVPGRHRSAHDHRSRLAARLSSQARQETLGAVPALSQPRQGAAAQEGRGGRNGHRDLADVDRRAGGASHRPERSRQGLRVCRAERGKLSNFKNELTGCGPFLHGDPLDRPSDVFNGVTSLHFGGARQPYLLLPVIPPKR